MKSKIYINEDIIPNAFNLKYFLDYSDYLDFVHKSSLYSQSNGPLYKVKLDQIYRDFPISYMFRNTTGTLHVVNLQVALALIDKFVETGDTQKLLRAEQIMREIIASDRAVSRNTGLYLLQDFYQPAYMLEPFWISGMAQGECISVLTRLFKLTGKNEYIELAENALLPMIRNVSEGGCAIYDPAIGLWIEEYPNAEFNNFVLNGFIFAIFGVYDLMMCGSDLAQQIFPQCLDALRARSKSFLGNHFSYYDLTGTVADRYYNHLHRLQFLALSKILDKPEWVSLSEPFKLFEINYEKKVVGIKKPLIKKVPKIKSLIKACLRGKLCIK